MRVLIQYKGIYDLVQSVIKIGGCISGYGLGKLPGAVVAGILIYIHSDLILEIFFQGMLGK
jgi:hypothetical protein